MAFHVERTGSLIEDKWEPKVGDILEQGKVMKVEKVGVMDFILTAIAGGIDLQGYDGVLINETFVTSAKDEDGICEIVGGMVTLIWVNQS